MTITLSNNPWLAPIDSSALARPGPTWLFGREIPGPGRWPALQWVMKRNCSITPRQLAAVYLSLCMVSMAISIPFFVNGAPFVLAFAGLELLLVGLALLIFARHAGDRETLTLSGHKLEVVQLNGRDVARAEFQAEWLAVEPAAGQGSLIELTGQGQVARVGRFLRPELRAAFAQEVRRALRRTRMAEPPALSPSSESEPKHAR